jgi:hypothetical protein
MKTNPVDLASPGWWGDDVDHNGSRIEQAQQGSGAAVGDDSSLAASQNRGVQSALRAWVAWPHRVDAAEYAM